MAHKIDQSQHAYYLKDVHVINLLFHSQLAASLQQLLLHGLHHMVFQVHILSVHHQLRITDSTRLNSGRILGSGIADGLSVRTTNVLMPTESIDLYHKIIFRQLRGPIHDTKICQTETSIAGPIFFKCWTR